MAETNMARVVVDTTVQEKSITFLTNTKLFSRVIIKLGKQAKHHDIKLQQSYARKAQYTIRKALDYAVA